MIKCPKCGSELAPGVISCPKCGVRFQSPVQSTPTQPVNNPKPQQQVPQSIPPQQPIKNDEPLVKSMEPEKTKKNNKGLLIVIAIILILGIVLFLYLNNESKKNRTNTNNQVFEYKEIVTNGYKLKIKKDWYIVEGNGNVIIKDVNSDLIIRLSNYKTSFQNYSKDRIETYLNNRDDIDNQEISELKIGNFETILVNANIKEKDDKTYNADYYYLKAGDNMIIGATIIYLKDNARNDNQQLIKNILQDISYSDDGLKATQETNNYANTFGLYGNILTSSNNN